MTNIDCCSVTMTSPPSSFVATADNATIATTTYANDAPTFRTFAQYHADMGRHQQSTPTVRVDKLTCQARK